jgi:hypothetical protein
LRREYPVFRVRLSVIFLSSLPVFGPGNLNFSKIADLTKAGFLLADQKTACPRHESLPGPPSKRKTKGASGGRGLPAESRYGKFSIG